MRPGTGQERTGEGRDAGVGLVEVMVATLILSATLLGVMGLFQWADRGLQEGLRATRALALAESRLDAMRTAPWASLLKDQPGGAGGPAVEMRDDGTPPDERGGDRVFTAGMEQDGITLVWTVEPDRVDGARPGSLARVGAVVITVRASYATGPGSSREIRLATLRANPNYVGPR